MPAQHEGEVKDGPGDKYERNITEQVPGPAKEGKPFERRTGGGPVEEHIVRACRPVEEIYGSSKQEHEQHAGRQSADIGNYIQAGNLHNYIYCNKEMEQEACERHETEQRISDPVGEDKGKYGTGHAERKKKLGKDTVRSSFQE